MATYSIGKFIDIKSKVCEEVGVEVIEISPKSDSASMNFWNAFTDIGMIPCSISVLPRDFLSWLKSAQAFFDKNETQTSNPNFASATFRIN